MERRTTATNRSVRKVVISSVVDFCIYSFQVRDSYVTLSAVVVTFILLTKRVPYRNKYVPYASVRHW